MAEQLTVSKAKIFELYVRMRRAGDTMDNVIEKLQAMANQLPREERHQLGKEVMDWEARNEIITQSVPQKPIPQPTPKPEPVQAVIANPQPEGRNRQSLSAAPTSGPSAFGTQFLDPSKLPALLMQKPVPSNTPTASAIRSIETPIACPKCGRKNPASEAYCLSCRAMLKSKVAYTRPIEKSSSKTPGGTAQFHNNTRIFLSVRGASYPLEVYVREEMVIGRALPNASINPNIDLSSYNAEELGVSRLHASLKRHDGTIILSDLESSNFTYVNGQRLYAHETRVLRHGDEIRLGKLVMKVSFKP